MSKRIFIDPGHSKKDSGAIGKNGTKERDITLSVGLKLANYLRSSGFEIDMSRKDNNDNLPSNISQDLVKRVQMANNFKADAFISIHCNAATNSNAKGFEIFTTPGQNNSDKLATKIFSKVKSTFPNLTYRTDLSDGDPDKEANFYVIKYANCPATLVEMAFISNIEEEKMLNNPDFQDKMAFAIAQGICDYFGMEIKKENNSQNNDNNIKLIVNGKESKIPIKLENGRSYVLLENHWIQLRNLAELIFAEIDFDENNKNVILAIK